jgi:Domain of Unknown Function (DUF928)
MMKTLPVICAQRISLCLMSFLFINYPTVAQTINRSDNSFIQAVDFVPDPPPSDPAPVGRGESASQGPCNITSRPDREKMYALVPQYENQAQTVDANPTFWVYVPYSATNFPVLHFVLWDTAGDIAYTQEISTTNVLPGVISFRLPQALPLNEQYDWKFYLSCGEVKLGVTGAITHVESSSELETALKAAATLEAQSNAYAQHGIWFEALTVLGDRRRSEPNNTALSSAWTRLLSDVGLEQFGAKPIVDCCKPSR